MVPMQSDFKWFNGGFSLDRFIYNYNFRYLEKVEAKWTIQN